MKEKRSQNLVLEGGGVKGIGLVGAIEALEKEGYEWAYLAGTSAGAIVATLMAVGYTGSELKTHIMENLDFSDMMEDPAAKRDFVSVTRAKKPWQFLFKIPQLLRLYGKLKRDFGLFSGNFIENYVGDLIKKRREGKNLRLATCRKSADYAPPS